MITCGSADCDILVDQNERVVSKRQEPQRREVCRCLRDSLTIVGVGEARQTSREDIGYIQSGQHLGASQRAFFPYSRSVLTKFDENSGDY